MKTTFTKYASPIMVALVLGTSAALTACAQTPRQASLGENIDDSVITTKIKAKFVEDSTVSALRISVETFKGTVQLRGFANSMSEIERAGDIARKIDGVKAVRNDILLKSAG